MTDAAVSRPGSGSSPRQPSNRIPARIAFVVACAAIGLLGAFFISSRSATTFRTSALVELPPQSEPSTYVSDALAVGFRGDDGRQLLVEETDTGLRFVGQAATGEVAAAVANESAEAFIAAQNDPEIRLEESAVPPESRTGDSRGRAPLIAGALGALVGLVLQPALKAPKPEPGVEFIESWTNTRSGRGGDRPTRRKAGAGDGESAVSDESVVSAIEKHRVSRQTTSTRTRSRPRSRARAAATDVAGDSDSSSEEPVEAQNAGSGQWAIPGSDPSWSGSGDAQAMRTNGDLELAGSNGDDTGFFPVFGDSGDSNQNATDEQDRPRPRATTGTPPHPQALGPDTEVEPENVEQENVEQAETARKPAAAESQESGEPKNSGAESTTDEPESADVNQRIAASPAGPDSSSRPQSGASLEGAETTEDEPTDADDAASAPPMIQDDHDATNQPDSTGTISPEREPEDPKRLETQIPETQIPETQIQAGEQNEATLANPGSSADGEPDESGDQAESSDSAHIVRDTVRDAVGDSSDPAESAGDDGGVETIDLGDTPAGLQTLLARTSVNIDPMIDRFAEPEDDSFVDELHEVWKASNRGAFQESLKDGSSEHLVEQITFLTSELSRYQELLKLERDRVTGERDVLDAEHARQVDALTNGLKKSESDNGRLRDQRDSARSVLQDRIGELELQLGSREREIARLRDESQAVASQQRSHEDGLATENEFLRREVERYQRTIDKERVAHATALANEKLQVQQEIDDMHREHRQTLNQLAHTNRNLLATQRNDAEVTMAALEADHQRQLEQAHTDYDRRVQKVKAYFEDKVASSDERVSRRLDAAREGELNAVRDELRETKANLEHLTRKLEQAESASADLERQRSQQRIDLEQAERSHIEERRKLSRRTESVEQQLAHAEARLAEERRRTSDVVRNLLEDSASSVAKAEQARQDEVEGRAALVARHTEELAAVAAQARQIQHAAAEREAALEATIASLRAATRTR